MSEIALVTIRKTRITELVKNGDRRALTIERLRRNPESLFATIQIGISVITIAASAFAGANISKDLAVILEAVNIPLIVENAYSISFIVVVALVSYVSITIGELIPKSLGLRYSEPVALWVAYPVYLLSKISGGLIKLLNITSNLFLKIFKDSTTFTESRLSVEEIRSLISEGRDAGTVESHEYNIIENVFNFSDLSVDKIMIPRTSMTAIDLEAPSNEVLRRAIDSGYSRIPVYKGDLNNIEGVLYTKKLLPRLYSGASDLDFKEFITKAYFIPGVMKISEVLHGLQKRKAHMALVTDEHGEIEGLVTLEDVLEEIVGEISDETDEPNTGIKQEGENFIVAGNISVVDFNKYFKIDISEDEDFNTISGFILEKLGRFPKEGDMIDYQGLRLKVKEVTARVVKRVVVQKI